MCQSCWTSAATSVLIGAGSGRRSAREAIDLSNDGGVTLGRLFTHMFSALPSNSDIARCKRHFAFVPTADIPCATRGSFQQEVPDARGVGAVPELDFRDRQEEAMDLDPYRAFRSLFASKTVRSAWAKSYGEQFWEASEPPQSQATVDDIKFITQRLRPSAETKLADLGCGGGCVGRYFASGFGADVEGIDADPLAIRVAEELAVTSGAGHRLRFKTGDVSKTG
jgi:hypothetical protein